MPLTFRVVLNWKLFGNFGNRYINFGGKTLIDPERVHVFLWPHSVVFLIFVNCYWIYDHDNIITRRRKKNRFEIVISIAIWQCHVVFSSLAYQMAFVSSTKLKYLANKWHHKLRAYYYYYLSNFGRRVLCERPGIFATIKKYDRRT